MKYVACLVKYVVSMLVDYGFLPEALGVEGMAKVMHRGMANAHTG